jgi:hypothetical protein
VRQSLSLRHRASHPTRRGADAIRVAASNRPIAAIAIALQQSVGANRRRSYNWKMPNEQSNADDATAARLLIKESTPKPKPKCFVIMPFSPTPSCLDWTEIYDTLIRPAITGSGFGYTCERSQIMSGAFVKDILANLYAADLVVADLTDRNPNVFYELGVRHALKNRTVLITQNRDHVPSDLAGYGVVVYKPSLSGLKHFRRDLKVVLKKIAEDPNRHDSPVADFLNNRDRLIYDFERHNVLRRLSALHAELFDNASTLVRNRNHFDDLQYPILGVFSRAIEDMLINQYLDIGIDGHTRLKQLLLSLQKLDYFAKLLTVPIKAQRDELKELYSFYVRNALSAIFDVKDRVQQLIKDVSNDNFEAQRFPPARRGCLFACGQ